ncbi:MAG: hypothetical protein N2689_10600, partial [Verrucomicrobiae bacterium]|nr:hypothetical protein [Verrucomicrobiae bacterium]
LLRLQHRDGERRLPEQHQQERENSPLERGEDQQAAAREAAAPEQRGERGGKEWREFLFTEMNFHEPQMFRGQRTVRDARYKLVLNLVTANHGVSASELRAFEKGGVNVGSRSVGTLPPVELFDLQADPDETNNLADDPAHAAVRQKLEAALQAWREKRADPLLDPARLQRWKDAAARWTGARRVPEGELELLK